MKKKNVKIAVLGAGNMGTTLANVIGKNGYEVFLWNYEGDPEPLEQIKLFRENKKYLPGVKLSNRIIIEKELEKAVVSAGVIFFAVPSSFIDSIMKRVEKLLSSKAVLVDISKGFKENEWNKNKKDKSKKYSEKNFFKNLVVISGPAIAIDLAKTGFTSMNIASTQKPALEIVKKILENDYLKLIPTNDVRGIKLAGALKNVYAILMGICDGLNLPMNTKSFLLVQALEEMGALIKKMGGKEETVYSLAGLGDLIGTGLCVTSRNRRFGEFLVYEETKEAALKKVGQVVEGMNTVKILISLAKDYKIYFPLAKLVFEIVWRKKDAYKLLTIFLKKFHVEKET